MCISDTSERGNGAGKTAFVYLVISVICALFGAVYEKFSHGVYSYYMIYAFAFPLCMGALPFVIISIFGRRRVSVVADNLWHSATATLTVGSIVRGALEIYGTSSRLTRVYTSVGIAAALLAAVITLLRGFRRRRA